MTHRHITEEQRERLELDRRHLLRKTTAQAAERMRRKTAREQLAEAQTYLQRGQDDVVPDADDENVRRF